MTTTTMGDDQHSLPSAPQRYRIGYMLAEKKRGSFMKASLVSLAQEHGLDLVAIDPALPLAEQGPYDAILQKAFGEQWVSQLREFAAAHPTIPVLDHPDAIAPLRDRASMLDLVSQIAGESGGAYTFAAPRHSVVVEAAQLACLNLRFPVVAKPFASDGSEASHRMEVVFQSRDLAKLKPPVVVQEFVNHGGVLFKVFVVGERVVGCMKRRSLADLSDGGRGSSFSFSKISNMGSAYGSGEAYEKEMDLGGAPMPPPAVLADAATGLSRATGLRLFNFDMIRESGRDGGFFIVDVNYFPGYGKLAGYESVFVDLLRDLVRASR